MPLKLKDKTLTGVAIIAFILLIPTVTAYAAATTQYIYDDLNRLERVIYPDGTVIEYYYDKLGNRIQKAILVADIAVTPTSYDFGLVSVGTLSASTRFTITSTGTANLDISTITTTGSNGSEFAIQNDNCSGQSIAPSSSCIVDVAFSPTSGGSKSASLTIPSNDPDTPTVNIALSGTGGYTLTVAKDGTWIGTVTSSPTGINCGSDCNEVYTIGTVVILTATPDTDSSFAGWSGGCTGTATTCTVTMNSHTTVTATFNILPPIADFTGTPTTGELPLFVNFTDSSTRAWSWSWDFGDGTTSTEQNPFQTYRDVGTYTVTLTVSNASGSDTKIQSDYIVLPCPNKPARIAGTATGYDTLQQAYDAAVAGDVIQVQALIFTENLSINKDITVTLHGGYDCFYTVNPGKTILKGQMTITDGAVTVGDFVVE